METGILPEDAGFFMPVPIFVSCRLSMILTRSSSIRLNYTIMHCIVVYAVVYLSHEIGKHKGADAKGRIGTMCSFCDLGGGRSIPDRYH